MLVRRHLTATNTGSFHIAQNWCFERQNWYSKGGKLVLKCTQGAEAPQIRTREGEKPSRWTDPQLLSNIQLPT